MIENITSLRESFPSLSRKVYISNGKIPEMLISNGFDFIPIKSKSFSSDESMFLTEDCFRLKFTNVTPQNGRWVNARLDLNTDVSKHRNQWSRSNSEYVTWSRVVSCDVSRNDVNMKYHHREDGREEGSLFNETNSLTIWLKSLIESIK